MFEGKLPYDPVCPSVGQSVGLSVRHKCLKGRKDSLLFSYRSASIVIDIYSNCWLESDGKSRHSQRTCSGQHHGRYIKAAAWKQTFICTLENKFISFKISIVLKFSLVRIYSILSSSLLSFCKKYTKALECSIIPRAVVNIRYSVSQRRRQIAKILIRHFDYFTFPGSI